MRLLVVRHAIAEDRDEFAQTAQSDDLRPLTRDGRKKMRRAARGLRSAVKSIDILATSPLTRAVETAEILSDEYGLDAAEQAPELSPGARFNEFEDWCSRRSGVKVVAVVGHEPHLSSLVTWLLTGDDDSRIALRKGGACFLEFDNLVTRRSGTLLWHVTPRMLRDPRAVTGPDGRVIKPHRADELTRPLKLSPWVIAGGAVVTAAMFAMLGYGIGRQSSGTSNRAPPSRVAMSTPVLSGTGSIASNRQIAMTPDGDGLVFVIQTENGGSALAYQRIGTDAPMIIPGTSGVQSAERPEDAIAVNRDGLRIQQLLDRGRKALAVRAVSGSSAGPALGIDLQSGDEKTIVPETVVEMRFTAGHLVYVREDGTIWAAPFDIKSLGVTEEPVQLGSGVAITGRDVAQFAVARNGNVAFVPEGPRSLVFVTREGRLVNVTPEKRNFNAPQFSPNGRHVSVDYSESDGRDVWLFSTTAKTFSRATFDRDGQDATWSVDGKEIIYTSFRTGSLGIYRTLPGNAAGADSLFASSSLAHTGTWIPDGSGIVTTTNNLEPGSRSDIGFVSNAGRGPIVPVIANSHVTEFPAVSPDGRWLAYVSSRSGIEEVYVRPWGREGNETLVSENGGSEPVWNPDGRHIFYRRNSPQFSELVEATVNAGPSSFTVTGQGALFPVTDMMSGNAHAGYDISPDGRTFVMVRRSPASRINVLQNLPGMVRGAREAGSPTR